VSALSKKEKAANAKNREPYSSNEVFRKLANRTAHGVGHPWAFAIAGAIVIAWALSGPVFHFSDTWQLVINTGTTIVTFLMVFLIQNTQNRDSHAIHLKLDELIRANKRARNELVVAEELTERELDELQAEFERLAKEKISRRELVADDDDESGPESDPQSASSSRTGPSSARTRSPSN
jgi:low affinity Fe/Cu permease